MNKTSVITLGFLILILANPGYVLSEEIHGLSIGFSNGAEFHYSVLVGKPAFDDFSVKVYEIGVLPENFTSYNQVTSNITGYWSNGTEISNLDSIWMWVPIGNWTYVQWLWGFADGSQIVNTDEIWGADVTDGETRSAMLWWKADGAFYELQWSISGTELHFLRTDVSTSTSSTPSTTTSTSTATATTESTTDTSGTTLFEIQDILLISVAGVGIVLVVVVIIVKKR